MVTPGHPARRWLQARVTGTWRQRLEGGTPAPSSSAPSLPRLPFVVVLFSEGERSGSAPCCSSHSRVNYSFNVLGRELLRLL